jgi:hypothetical protein
MQKRPASLPRISEHQMTYSAKQIKNGKQTLLTNYFMAPPSTWANQKLHQSLAFCGEMSQQQDLD